MTCLHVPPRPNNWFWKNCVEWLESNDEKQDEPGEPTDSNEDVTVTEKHVEAVKKVEAHNKNILAGEITHGYGGFCNSENNGEPCVSEKKLNWSRFRCVMCIVNKCLLMKDELLVRDKKIPRYQLDAHDVDWFWGRV